MDGHEVGVSVRGETSVTISGLTSSYLYSIQVLAVNAQGFRVSSPTFYVRTRPKEDKVEQDEVEDAHEPHMQSHPQAELSSPAFRSARSKANMDPNKLSETQSTIPTPTTSEEVKKPESKRLIADLTFKMDAIRKETSEIDSQLSQIADSQSQEEAVYTKKLDELRTKKKEDDDAKSAKDQYHKQLDQQRREIESKRNQAQKALKAAEDEYRKQTTDIQSFKDSTKNSLETVEHLQESMKTLAAETDEAVQDAERTAAIASEELGEIESEIRYLLSRKAESEGELARLQSSTRVPSPSPQEIAEEQAAESSWKEREDSLMRQYEDAQTNLLRLQGHSHYPLQAARSGGTTAPDLLEYGTAMRRRESRRGIAEETGRPDSASRMHQGPTFNPDAAPFVAAAALYSANETSLMNTYPLSKSIFTSAAEPYTAQHTPFAQQSEIMNYAGNRSSPYANSSKGTTSIFNDEPQHPRIPSPFVKRESSVSSHSGSNPPSPAVQTRPALPSIFNSVPTIQSRNSAGSLVDRLNGTPIDDTAEQSNPKDASKWTWSGKKKNIADPLALDRKNTRSLPKVDVAPIGTRRNRSGSLREDNNNESRAIHPSVVTGYHDVDLLNVIAQPTARDTENDDFATSAFLLPRPSSGSAFGWEPQVPSSQRRLPNPWNTSDAEHSAATSRGFDPFGDMPVEQANQLSSVKSDFLSSPIAYHTTIDADRLSTLHREASNGSRKSTKSRLDSQESKEKHGIRRLGETGKFSSFVGRVFGKKDERESLDEDGSMSPTLFNSNDS